MIGILYSGCVSRLKIASRAKPHRVAVQRVKHQSFQFVMAPKPKWEPKKMPKGCNKAPAKAKPLAKQIMKPKKYPKGSAGRQWREQVAASQKRASAAAAAVVAFAASSQTNCEAATTAILAPAPADDCLANIESDLECDPFSDIY